MKWNFIYILFISLPLANIIHESGELSEFLGGHSPGSSYDNWVSHVTEGIASDGFNDYGPDWLDVQTTGFGNYNKLEFGDPILSYWEDIFSSFILGDTTLVDSLLQDSIESFYYELVIFEDTVYNQIFHIIREQLDTNFIDLNQSDNDLDDVVGSFRNGWGMYIINPQATREQVVIQVPHPCDDFIAPYIAIDIFLETNAFAFMINGAGREVLWTEVGNYSNSKSLSDPSRYPNTIFQKFQEVAVHPLIGINPHWPLVFAIHSFDNESHEDRKSIIVAAGGQNSFTTKPIRDITDDHFDIINFTSEYPIDEGQFGNTNSLHVTDYYEVFYDDHCVFDNGETEFPITLATELKGPSNGVQMVDLQNLTSNFSVYEPWIHIELDEKPMLFDSIGISNDSIYQNGSYPTGIQNFTQIREYYQPFIHGLNSYLTHWETVSDQGAPDSIEFITAYNVDNSDEVYMSWAPVYDTNFKTFQIQADTDTLFNDPILFDLEDYDILQYMRLDHQTLSGLSNTEPWWFQIRGIDHFNNAGPWSESVSNILPGHSSPDTILYFSDGIALEGIINEDIDQDSFAIDYTNTFPGNSPTLEIYGNCWKSLQIDPFMPDSGTILQVFAKIDSISEIQGIGFSNGENSIRYSFSGYETLDIEEWIPVYQGVGQIGSWHSYRIPIGDDWLAWYDSLSVLNEVHFINDHDDTNSAPGSVYFSMVRDITPDLPIDPSVSIEFDLTNFRNERDDQIVTASFYSTIQDTDSYAFSYNWEFGDGESSDEANPVHDYIIEDDHDYTVILTVEDETGRQGWATTTIQVDQGNSSFPLKFNFVGDIMMGRRFEEIDGIITTQGVNALFEPTRHLLGMSADITVANLEIPLSDQGYPHPSKSIIFRSAPQNIAGLIYAGIDVVSLANNHILDYMEPAMIQTQNILSEAGIIHSGAGMNSYEAYLPAFKSVKGQTIAFLASSDRTGQYNNYQPYLNAGVNKPGFAYMTPYYLKQQIQSVEEVADLIVVEMHAGSEYSYSPGADYDSYTPIEDFADLRTNPASGTGFQMMEKNGMEAEDYSWRLDRPQMWDRAIRHFTIDEGADIVVVHHPHIIQGLEMYDGKLIAHSLGNFIFDLNYPETYPSMILNAEANESGFTAFSIDPVYIDDYLTVPAKGDLGNYILDYIAMRSKELSTFVHVDNDNQRAYVIIDSLAMPSSIVDYNAWIDNYKPFDLNGESYFHSDPIPLTKPGSLSQILAGDPSITHYRLGREKIWMKNFEDEGSSLWNLNSINEMIQDSVVRKGEAALLHIRSESSPDNIVTNLEERIPFKNEHQHTVHGFIKTENGKEVTIEVRCAIGRSGESLFTASMGDSLSGSNNWQKYWGDIPIDEGANYFDIRLNSGVPDSGFAFSWFDDVGLVEWDSLKEISQYPISISHPNDYEYVQLFFNEPQPESFGLQIQNTIIGDLDPLTALPKVVAPIITTPNYFYFYDESTGPVGERLWKSDGEIIGYGSTPELYCEDPGVYEISLTVYGPNGQEDITSFSVIGLEPGSAQYEIGDVNGDGVITVVDALLCSNYILGLFNLQPQEFLAADADGNNLIDIFDVLLVSDLSDQ